jgi:hypothetical protein
MALHPENSHAVRTSNATYILSEIEAIHPTGDVLKKYFYALMKKCS